jgi:DNA-directed RNA polymerase beta subunit
LLKAKREEEVGRGSEEKGGRGARECIMPLWFLHMYGTCFGGNSVEELGKGLVAKGFSYGGKDFLTSGVTGEPLSAYFPLLKYSSSFYSFLL